MSNKHAAALAALEAGITVDERADGYYTRPSLNNLGTLRHFVWKDALYRPFSSSIAALAAAAEALGLVSRYVVVELPLCEKCGKPTRFTRDVGTPNEWGTITWAKVALCADGCGKSEEEKR